MFLTRLLKSSYGKLVSILYQMTLYVKFMISSSGYKLVFSIKAANGPDNVLIYLYYELSLVFSALKFRN